MYAYFPFGVLLESKFCSSDSALEPQNLELEMMAITQLSDAPAEFCHLSDCLVQLPADLG